MYFDIILQVLARVADGKWLRMVANRRSAVFFACKGLEFKQLVSDPISRLKVAGIRGLEHEVKANELGTKKNLSKFDLCGCKDRRVVVKAHGCKGPIISVTNFRWR